MIALYRKEIKFFLSGYIGPLIIIIFQLINGLILWSELSYFSITENNYASLDAFFKISPLIFSLFIPAICMRTFSEEYSTGTIEILLTKPINSYKIVLSKFLANQTLIIISLIPSLLFVVTIYYLGETRGNLDLAGIAGSYIGLFLLSCIFTSFGLFASSLTNNQIVAFIYATILSLTLFLGFDLLANINHPNFPNLFIRKIGIAYHYDIMSKGLLQISDVVYFISITFLFLDYTRKVIINQRY